MGDSLTTNGSELSIGDRILSYIPDSKDLVLRKDGGCMLANGDIFCWGDNKYKRAGIENYGQIDTSLKPDYINTPVMLKVQIENIENQNLILFEKIGGEWTIVSYGYSKTGYESTLGFETPRGSFVMDIAKDQAKNMTPEQLGEMFEE